MSRVRFGSFELDLASGELFPSPPGDGRERTVLREQPLRVLRLLIQNAPELVTRDDMKARLWPNDTIVDFDHGINVAIGVLRRALGDSATSPRYIETLGRRGYRLLAPVERLPPSGSGVADDARTPPSDLVGRNVSHYRVLEVIGGGGMGMVYKAEDLKLGRRVALKFLPEELAGHPASLRMLEREARTASAINHPNICTIFDIDEHDGQPFIAMELLEGETLRELSSRQGARVPLAALLEIAVGICNGLSAAHRQGVIHRDIKPANVFLTKQGPVKILDFGIAKLIAGDGPEGVPTGALAGTATHGTLAAGTPSYMSPEQVRREPLDVRTDIFSLGLVLYEMAAGVRAFEGDTRAAIQDAIVNAEPAPARDRNASVPRSLDAVLDKALEKDRSRRYQSADEMRADLERVQRVTHPGRRRVRVGLAAAAAAAVLAAGVFLYQDFRRRVTLSETDTLVLADMANRTSDPAFDVGLGAAARAGLEQTPYLNVLAADKVLGTLAQLKLPLTTDLTPEVARRVCLQTNSRLVVAPSLADAGTRFQIVMDALDCRSGAVIAEVHEDAASRSEVVHALGVAEAKLRRKLGEPANSLARFDKPLEVATSASPEALQFAVAAYKRFYAGDNAGTLSLCRRALELDPLYAVVYTGMAASHGNLGQLTEAAAAATKAFELRDRMTEPYRLLTESFYYEAVTGEMEKAYSVAAGWVKTYPRNGTARSNLAHCLTFLGRLDQAADEARKAVRLAPYPRSYFESLFSSIVAGRLGEAKATFDEAEARGLVNADVLRWRLALAFLQKDEPAIQELRARAEKEQIPGLLQGFALLDASRGRFRADRAWTQRATDAAVRAGRVANYGAWAALRESEVGNAALALETAERALPNVRNPNDELILALAYAQAGDVARARKLSDKVAADRPLDTLVQKYCLPTIRAAIKLQEKDPAAAVEILEPARAYELAAPVSIDSLRPAYVRGLAYLALGQGRAAAAEFQKLIDHPGLVGLGAIAALPRLQRARAQKLAGDEAAARVSYEEFLALWKDADSEIPVYREAKAEYANLPAHLARATDTPGVASSAAAAAGARTGTAYP